MKSDMNYYDTFIEIAADFPVETAVVPEEKGAKKTMAQLQYEMIALNPYRYTQEDVLFETYADYNGIPTESRPLEREKFFSKGQPCLRASALGKRYGWGVHSDAEGRVALYPIESPEYKQMVENSGIKHLKAMRSKRA